MNDELLALERELAGVIELVDLAGPTLETFRRLAGATGSGLFSFDQAGMVSTLGGTLAQSMLSYTPDLFADDVTWHLNFAEPPGQLLSSTDAFDKRTFTSCRAYADFYRPHEIGSICGLRPTGLPFGAPGMFGLMFCTPTLSRRFEVDRTKRLRQLELPLRTAARRIARFRSVAQKQQVLQYLLERQRGSFVLWDAEGSVVFISAKAQHQLEGALARSGLERAAASALRQLRRADLRGRDAMLGRPRQLRSARGAPLRVEFSWIAAADQRPWLLAELESCAGPNALLARLNTAERRVLRLLMQGLSNLEIASRLAVSNETVKTHVKHLLAKLGVSSRSAASRIAHEARWDY
jgi:DNA-binding CsgD family transcriptional regulator